MRRLVLAALCLSVSACALVPAGTATAQVAADPCQAFTPCTPVSGPFTVSPPNDDALISLACPQDMVAVGADTEFQGAVYPVLISVVSEAGLGGLAVLFGVPALPVSVTYQPWIGCSPLGSITLQFRGGAGAQNRIRVRSERLHPGRHVRVHSGCARGERPVRSGSVVAFFTHHPPSRRVVAALAYRQRRNGATTRADTTAPKGMVSSDRVELRMTTVCSG